MGNVRDEGRLSTFFEILSSDVSALLETRRGNPAASERLLKRMRKRAAFDTPGLAEKTIANFVDINSTIPMIGITLSSYEVNNAREFIFNALSNYTASLDPTDIQGVLYKPFLYDNWRFGPGASNGVRGSHTADKITQAMTCTTSCEPLVRKLRISNVYFALKDEGRDNGISLVTGSRMSTVPKNEDVMRTIAIEPSGNMAMQLAAGRYLENVLRYIGLDISTQQPKNKALALAGSIDGSLATIDLSSASDMIQIDLVRMLFPSEWFNLLVSLRSPVTELPDGTVVPLNMMSTMGNGFTFPLMTLIFTALVYANRPYKRGDRRCFIDWSNTAVFGDDIIVPTHEYQSLVNTLTRAGFSVNTDKSYYSGPFRESCGGDYWLGVDITPFYVKSLSQTHDIYVVLNQVLAWCGRHEVILTSTLLYLKALIGKVLLIPEWYNPNQGVLTKAGPARFKYLSIIPSQKRLKPTIFEMMLAVGGYVEQSGPHLSYTPRSRGIKVCVRSSRYPRGYLDGHCPYRYNGSTSEWIALITLLILQ